MSIPNFSVYILISFLLIKEECMKCKRKESLIVRINFEIFLPNLFANLPQIGKNNFRKALFQFAKYKFHKIS